MSSMNQAKSVICPISKYTVKPRHTSEESQQSFCLTPWDILVLSTSYIETGLFFTKPKDIAIQTILDRLQDSLSTTLTHYFPLSGRLVTKKTVDPPSYHIFLDCKDGPGVEFVHAVCDFTVSDILSPTDVPPIVQSLFALNRPISYDGHTLPLLAVQVTELVDGIFIGCSVNHVVADGNSFWNFFNAWSQVSRAREHNSNTRCISRHPITKRWYVNDQDRIINLPYSHPDEFIERFVPKPYTERIFHFTSQSIAHLKAKANADLGANNISSFQALAALVWRSVTRARRLLANQTTKCWVIFDDRSRLDPPLSRDYFGNYIWAVDVKTTGGELLSKNLGWCAWMFHKEIADHTNTKVRSNLEESTNAPSIFHFGKSTESGDLLFGMSPRFDVYTNDFGWGEPIAVRSGYGIKFDGKVTLYPGREGGGSVDLELCLLLKSMSSLESDDEFMTAVSPAPTIE